MKKLLLTLAAGLFMTASASAATVYFDNSATNWSPVNAYVWEPNNGWPGEPTTNVTIDGHALCAFEITGGQTKIIFNNGAGKQTADLKATDGAVYDASGTTPIAQIVDGKYVTGGDLPPVEPTVAVLYLRGDMNSWGATDEWKFTTTDNDTYVLANVDVKKTQSWKIADAGWDDYNFGGATNIALNTAVTMVAGSNTNCNLAADGTNLTFTFVLSTSTLTVTGEGGGGDDPVPPTPVDPTDTDLYLRGSMNGWDAVDAWKFTTTDNDTYVLANVAVSAAATWKIAGAAWGDVYNFGDATGIEFDTPVVLSASSNSGNCTLAAGGDDVTFTFVLSTKTLTVKNNGVIIAPTAPELYLRGSMGGTAWPALPEWKFTTTDDDTYVLSGVSVTAADTWKIADAEWGSYNYGGIQGISLNEEVTLVYDGDNCSLAVDGTDLTFTFVLSTKTLKVTGKGTEPIDPPVGDYRTLYLVGEMTDWKLDEAYEMTRTNNVYTITLADGLTGAWKIWDGTWDYSFGVGEQPEVGVETDCWFNSTDFTVNTTGKTTVTLTLVEGSDVADTSVPSKILIQGEAVDPEPVSAPEKLYLVGDTTGWEVSDAFLMTRNDNVYTLKLADGITGEWKIWDGTWNFSFGAGEEQPVLGKETDVWFKSSNNFTLNHDSATEIIFTLVEGSYEAGSSVPATLLVKKDNSGVSDVEVDAAPAKFYNLQGVEVANPENGLFIEVRGNAVRKVVR